MINCIICGSSDWKNVDKYRDTPKDMEMCQKCGFVTYPKKIKDDSKLRDFYRKEYRVPPQILNLDSGNRKLFYHSAFLRDLFDTWVKEKKEPVVFEQGAAMGMFLNWMRGIFPKGQYSGSELTLSFRRVAKHKFGLNLSEDFDDTKKYDFISSYKVIEHVPFADKELRKMVLSLKDDGLIYVSVPTWFDKMTNFGVGGFTLNYYYATEHINVWTQKLWETLLKKVGLEVIKFDGAMYDETYLCKRNDALMKEPPKYEDPKEIEERMNKIQQAWKACDGKDFKKAIEIWPYFPFAHMGAYEVERNGWHQKGIDEIKKGVLDRAIKECKDYPDMYTFSGDILMRYSKWDEAIEMLKKSLKLKPENSISWKNLSQCFRQMSLFAETEKERYRLLSSSIGVLHHVIETSRLDQVDAINWMFSDMAKIPMNFKEDQNGSINN